MKDIFGNDLKPGDFFTYTATQKYAHIRIGRVLADGQSVKTVAASAWNRHNWTPFNGRPNESVLRLDPSTIPSVVCGLLS